jgi:hypothetical protein
LLGALVGYWALGMELTILSLFGIFGLGVATVLVLVVIPALLAVHERWAERWTGGARVVDSG